MSSEEGKTPETIAAAIPERKKGFMNWLGNNTLDRIINGSGLLGLGGLIVAAVEILVGFASNDPDLVQLGGEIGHYSLYAILGSFLFARGEESIKRMRKK